MKTIIAGSRTASKRDVWNALCTCPWTDEITSVISGCAQGADSHGASWAKWKSYPVIEMPADWKSYGRSAGMIRNQAMLNQADALLAVWDGHSPGTKNMISIAKRKGIKYFVFLTT
jgi:hypothetical protein